MASCIDLASRSGADLAPAPRISRFFFWILDLSSTFQPSQFSDRPRRPVSGKSFPFDALLNLKCTRLRSVPSQAFDLAPSVHVAGVFVQLPVAPRTHLSRGARTPRVSVVEQQVPTRAINVPYISFFGGNAANAPTNIG